MLLFSVQAGAQGGPTTIQFSFSNPGARSLGLGGAFAAIADDATAAFANPAGLTQLTRPEVSIEGRQWRYSTPFAVGGRVSGEPTGIGLDTPIRTGVSEFDSTSLSFLSFVYPGRDWTLAVSRHQSARFEASAVTRTTREGPKQT
jgi:long-subunit fatty acid transport protein